MTQLQDKFGAFEKRDSPPGTTKWRAVMSMHVFFQDTVAAGTGQTVKCNSGKEAIKKPNFLLV